MTNEQVLKKLTDLSTTSPEIKLIELIDRKDLISLKLSLKMLIRNYYEAWLENPKIALGNPNLNLSNLRIAYLIVHELLELEENETISNGVTEQHVKA